MKARGGGCAESTVQEGRWEGQQRRDRDGWWVKLVALITSLLHSSSSTSVEILLLVRDNTYLQRALSESPPVPSGEPSPPSEKDLGPFLVCSCVLFWVEYLRELKGYHITYQSHNDYLLGMGGSRGSWSSMGRFDQSHLLLFSLSPHVFLC